MLMINEFDVANHSSIVVFTPLSGAAQDWWNENVNSDAMQCGSGYAVEHRFAKEIIEAMKFDEDEDEKSAT